MMRIVALCAFAAIAISACARSGEVTDDSPTRDPANDARFAGRTYAGDAKRGELIFATNCSTCHGQGGRSGGVGPSLIDENARQDLARTIVWIENPNPPMPKLYPSPLSEREVEDVAAYVQNIR